MPTAFEQALTDTLNKIAKEDGMTFGREPNWRYFSSKNLSNKNRAKDRYFWTTEVARYKGKTGYLSGIRRYRSTKKAWQATAVIASKKRSTAKARALKFCNLERSLDSGNLTDNIGTKK